MKFNRHRRTPELQLASAGMIDIVFLLLIFFLVNSSFRPVERQVESELTDPAARSSSLLEPLVVRIQPGANGFEFQVGGRHFPDRAQLKNWLVEWQDREQRVLVIGPAAAPVELSIATLNDLRLLGFKNVSYVPDRSPAPLDRG
jgi:biopolymer transport protein ExbD